MEERIKQLLEMEGLTPAEFADRIKIQRPSVSHVLSGRNKPGYVFIQKILQGFPSLNARWLLNGEGTVFEDQVVSQATQKEVPNLFTQSNSEMGQSEMTSVSSDLKKEKTILESVKTEKEKTIDNHSDFAFQIEKQNHFSSENKKKAERIVIFYTDKTFEEYYPSL